MIKRTWSSYLIYYPIWFGIKSCPNLFWLVMSVWTGGCSVSNMWIKRRGCSRKTNWAKPYCFGQFQPSLVHITIVALFKRVGFGGVTRVWWVDWGWLAFGAAFVLVGAGWLWVLTCIGSSIASGGHTRLPPTARGPQMFSNLHIFLEHLLTNNSNSEIAAICNRLLAYITVLCYVQVFT